MEKRDLVLTKDRKITSLELLKEINFFRNQESNYGKTEIKHKDLLKIIRSEFDEEIREGKISPSQYNQEMPTGGVKKLPMFNLTISQAKQVLVRESKVVRKAVIKRLEELEDKPRKLSVVEILEQSTKMLKQLNNKNIVLENKIIADKPRVSFAETIEKSSECILIREYSKILANEGIKLGERKLYAWLRNKGYIQKNSTEPTQRAVEQGLFKVSERIVKTVKGEILSQTTKLTGKGQIFFIEKFKISS